ncbi:MAG TPA: GGDEF domain-containing protein [Burkholderiaceae bacterium]|nr:GGDEF domain-containing protein [Burkholderiaceae bacterium]
MSELVDHLAHLTGFRDRDVLDVTLVAAFRDLLNPRAVTIYRIVADSGSERWLTRARLAQGDVAATADPAWIDLDLLPPLDAYPFRRDCLRSHEVVVVEEDPCLNLFPVSTDREVVGVLEIETDQPMSPADQRMVVSILRIYRNFEGLLDYSERDTLTGLLNRKTFDETFMKTALAMPPPANAAPGRRASGTGGGHWLGVIDIDHFKQVNDNFGHLIGDEVLLLLSRLMRSTFRFHDRLYRFGGEEFVVLVRCNNDDDAMHAFERLRANTERYAFPQVGRITVSVGFTEVKPTDTPSTAFERADKAVYYAKTHGRNRVCNHADLVIRGEIEDGTKVGDIELF